jgi:hypothetical protein
MTDKPSDGIPPRVVGKRRTARTLSGNVDTREKVIAWRKAFPTPFVKKGVYRFRSHEEADRSLWEMITRPKR